MKYNSVSFFFIHKGLYHAFKSRTLLVGVGIFYTLCCHLCPLPSHLAITTVLDFVLVIFTSSTLYFITCFRAAADLCFTGHCDTGTVSRAK